MKHELTITKLDAARSQLETAIRLYFHNGDPVSIHTLTAAGYNVIRDINDSRGGEPMMTKQQMLERVKPEFKKMFRDKVNEAENFFKHADKHPSATLTFIPFETDMLLFDACSQYCRLIGEDLPIFAVFRSWFIANNPDLFILGESEAKLLLAATPAAVQFGRLKYYKTLLPQLLRAHDSH